MHEFIEQGGWSDWQTEGEGVRAGKGCPVISVNPTLPEDVRKAVTALCAAAPLMLRALQEFTCLTLDCEDEWALDHALNAADLAIAAACARNQGDVL